MRVLHSERPSSRLGGLYLVLNARPPWSEPLQSFSVDSFDYN